MTEHLTRAKQNLAAQILKHSPRKHMNAVQLHEIVGLARALAEARAGYTRASTVPSPNVDVEALGQRVVECQRALLAPLDRLA